MNEDVKESVSNEQKLSSVTELVKQAWEFYKGKFRILIGVFLIPAILTALIGFFAEAAYTTGSAFLLFPGTILIVVVQIVATIALLHVVVSKDEILAVQDAYRRGLEGFFSYLWIAVLVTAITAVGFLLFIVPGVIFSIWFSFSFLVFVSEGKYGFDALMTSKEYIKGYWWATFGRFIFLGLIAIAALIVLGVVTALSAIVSGLDVIVSEVGGAIFSLFFTPFSLVYMYLIYRELKERKSDTNEAIA